MTLNPKFLVWNVQGIYDGSCASMDEAVARTAPSLRARITNRCYTGGHMVYSDLQTRKALQRDFAAFVRAALAVP
jgi:carboxypeptidase C (cathepsin A)